MATPTDKKAAPSSSTPYKSRLARLAADLAGRSLSHLLVTSPVDVGYLTGFLGGDSYLLVGGARPVIISDFRYQEELVAQKPIAELVIRKASMTEAVAELVSSSGVKSLGIQAECMTVAERDVIAKKLGKGVVQSTTGLLSGMRRVKDEHEVSLISKAIKLQEQSLLAVLPTIKPGQTELSIAARLDAEMKSRGASGTAFGTIVAARTSGSLPHYHPGAVKTAANQSILIDWGAIYKGYRGDMTRTFALGKWPKKIAEIYAIVLEAHEKAAGALAAGKKTGDIDKIARDHIAAAGYGDNFGHGLGHGLGLDTHEEPRMSHMLKGTTLAAGNVVTIEPGIYLPGVGGVRIEDDYLVTDTGSRNLSSLPKDIEWATLS